MMRFRSVRGPRDAGTKGSIRTGRRQDRPDEAVSDRRRSERRSIADAVKNLELIPVRDLMRLLDSAGGRRVKRHDPKLSYQKKEQ